MKIKRLFVFAISAFIMFSLCGCDLFTADTEEMLQPPSLSGELAPISKALEKAIGTDYTLKYPTNGNYRSAVIQKDINGDGILEAFAFYSKTEGDTTMMYINILCNKSGEWKSVAEQKIVAGGVDRVDFCDLDGDGTEEILSGWEIYGTSEMQLAVYSFNQDILSQRMLQRYSYFCCTDLDEDGKNEIFMINFNPAENINRAGLYQLADDGVRELTGCVLDSSVKTVNEPVVSTLSNGKPAVYIDEIKGAGAVTEVLFVDRGMLVNPLLNTELRENMLTLRSASIMTADINRDGIMEIPVQGPLPSAKKDDTNESLYYTNWCSYNGETLTNQLTAVMNLNDGYYIAVPPKWVGNIAVLKDTEKKVREIYRYNGETEQTGEMLLCIQAVPVKELDSDKAVYADMQEIARSNGTAFICALSDDAANDGVTLDTVKKNFNLIEQ